MFTIWQKVTAENYQYNYPFYNDSQDLAVKKNNFDDNFQNLNNETSQIILGIGKEIPTENDFLNQVSNACLNEDKTRNLKLEKYVLEFYQKLGDEFFEKQKSYIKKSYFENINVGSCCLIPNGVSQNEIFANNANAITMQEYFRYIFVNYVSKIKEVEDNDNNLTEYNFCTKSISLRKYDSSLVKIYNRLSQNQSVSFEQVCKDMELYQKNVMFHELSHLMEMVVYSNKRYMRCGSDFLYDDKKKEIQNPEVYVNNKSLFNIIVAGKRFLSEILNEVYSTKIFDSKSLLFCVPNQQDRQYSEMLPDFYPSKTFGERKSADGYWCVFDVLVFLNVLGIVEDINEARLNSQKLIRKINDLQFSNSIINKNLLSYQKTLNSTYNISISEINELNNYQILCLFVGLYTDVYQSNYKAKTICEKIYSQEKLPIYEILLSALQNNLKKQLTQIYNLKRNNEISDKEIIYKLKKFDINLCRIYGLLMKPNKTIFHNFGLVNTLDVYSYIDFAKKYKNLLYLQQFKECIDIIESFVQTVYKDNSEQIMNNMFFIKSQQLKHEKLVKKKEQRNLSN